MTLTYRQAKGSPLTHEELDNNFLHFETVNNFPSLRPSLLLAFRQGRLVSPRLSVARASNASYFNSLGVLVQQGQNQGRITFDAATGECLGLSVEPAATNLCLRSEQLSTAPWTTAGGLSLSADAATAPDGALTAETITLSGASQGLLQNVTVSANTTYTVSWYAKLGTLVGSNYKFAMYDNTAGAFIATDIVPTVTVVTDAWVRVTHTLTTPAGCTSLRVYPIRNTANVAGTIHLWGVQLESGSVATSYIPTTSATASRTADVATLGGTSFSDWFNPKEGTLLFRGRTRAVSNAILAHIGESDSDRISFFHNGSSSASFRVSVGGSHYSPADIASDKNDIRVALAYKAGTATACSAGSAVTTSAPPSIPSVTTLRLGANATPTLHLNGEIDTFAYYPRALTAAQLQALTS